MYAPIRGGTRGGQGDFKWSDVQADEHRENYLGHSINAPKGRWQNNRDVTWYLKDGKEASREEEEKAKADELRKIKEAEEDALSLALGFTPTPRVPKPPIDPNQAILDAAAREREKELYRIEKEERKLKRAEKRFEREGQG